MDYLSFVDKSETHHNIDNVFNYLSKSGQLICKSWYIEGSHVFHMPDTLIDASRTHYWKYQERKVIHPFLSFFYNETVFSERPLLPFLHKIDLHYSDEDMHEYMIKERAGGRTPFSVPNSRLDVALALGYIDKKTYNKYWRCPTTVLILYFVVYFVA